MNAPQPPATGSSAAAVKAPPPELVLSQPDFAALNPVKRVILNKIYGKIKESIAFTELLPDIQDGMLEFLDAQRMTVYQNARDGKEIVAKFKTGQELAEIRLPLSPASVAGYVALSQKPTRISDVNDPVLLEQIHPRLKFDSSFDKRSGFNSKSMMCVPIKVGAPLLGVLQVINKTNGNEFTEEDLAHAQFLAKILGEKFQLEFEGTNGPYEYLIKKGKLTPEDLDKYLKQSKKDRVSMTYVLTKEHKIPWQMVAASLESYYQVPFMRYDPNVEPPKKLMEKFNRNYMLKQRFVPIAGEMEKEVVILIDDPSDITRQMEIQKTLPAKKYIFRVGFEDDILQYLGVSSGVSAAIYGLVDDLSNEGAKTEIEDTNEQEVDENAGAVIQLVNRLIIEAHRAGASDIHIEPGKVTSKVRFRIDGACRDALEIPSSHIRAVLSRLKIMSRLDIAERRKPQDGKIVLKVGQKVIELRLATIPTVYGEGAVMRVLAAGGALPFDKLNLNDRNFRETIRLINIPYGIFLVVGPTGSGKTTTLHAVLGKINTPDRKIWTAEDPVEITQPGLAQVQMDNKIGLNFATALRAFLRADPDVILIGEMRDHETAHVGIEASLTGHLVFSTLHTNSAPETITRLLDLGIDPLNFADALLGVLAQRLVRTLCKDCKEPYKPTQAEWERMIRTYGKQYWDELHINIAEQTLYKPVGCGVCAKTGYKGRTGIHELLANSDALKRLIAGKAKIAELREQSMKESMRTLIQDGVMKVLKGQFDLEQLFKVAASEEA